MTLTKIEIIKYKSIVNPVTINFKENLPVIFIGKNGSGKTNVLETLEKIARANSQSYYYEKANNLEYKVYFKLSKEEVNSLLPNIEYDEEKSEVIAYSTNEGIRINRIKSEYLVPELKKVILDIRETAKKLKAALDLYKKQLYKLFHEDGMVELPINCYQIKYLDNSTTSFFRLYSKVEYFIEQAERETNALLAAFDDDENSLNYINNRFYIHNNVDIRFKLEYVKPSLPRFEKKFISINEAAIKREITKINKATAKACDEIQECINRIGEQATVIINGLDTQYVTQEEVDNRYFHFLREAQSVVAKKCLFLKNENNEILFNKEKYDIWNNSYRSLNLTEVYFRQVYQGKDKEKIIEKLSGSEKIDFSNEAVEEFEAYINLNLPKFEAGMFDRISIEQHNNGQLSFLLHEKTGEVIRLNETSSGRRWYFSYYFMKNMLEKEDMFIIDEPASMLHPSAQKEVLLELQELANKGVRIVYSTHSPYLISNEWKGINFVAMTDKGTIINEALTNKELISQMSEIVGEDIFAVQAVVDMYNQGNPNKIGKNCYDAVKRKTSDLQEAAAKLFVAEDTIKSWNRKGGHFRCPKLENIIAVCKYTNTEIRKILN